MAVIDYNLERKSLHSPHISITLMAVIAAGRLRESFVDITGTEIESHEPRPKRRKSG